MSDQQNDRELRKDRSSRLSSIRDELSEIELDAITFHTADEFDRSDAQSLVRRLSLLSRELSMLHRCAYLADDYTDTFIVFKQACTQDNFDWNPKTFVKQGSESPLLGDIMAARDALDDLIIDSLTHTLTTHKPVSDSVSGAAAQLRGWCSPVLRRLFGEPTPPIDGSDEN